MGAAGEVQLEVLGRGERPPAVGMRAGAGVLQVAILADLVSGLSIEVEFQSGELHTVGLFCGKRASICDICRILYPPLVSMGECVHNTILFIKSAKKQDVLYSMNPVLSHEHLHFQCDHKQQSKTQLLEATIQKWQYCTIKNDDKQTSLVRWILDEHGTTTKHLYCDW